MWTRFLPHMVQVRQHLADGDLGDVRVVLADHNQQFPPDPTHRLFAPELGGGALLDLGIYPMSFASMVLGEPQSVTAVATKAFTGVDAQTAVVLGYDDGRQAVVFTTLEVKGPNRAAIVGTKARIEIDEVWYTPTTFRLIAADGTVLRAYDEPHEGHGLRHQAAEVARCLREGLVESPLLTHEETVSIMRTLDEIRVQVGVTYPTEISPGVPRRECESRLASQSAELRLKGDRRDGRRRPADRAALLGGVRDLLKAQRRRCPGPSPRH